MKLPPNKTHVDVIADYLRRFHDYVYEELSKTFLLKEYRQNQYRYVGKYIYKRNFFFNKKEGLTYIYIYKSVLRYLLFGLMKQKHSCEKLQFKRD